MMIDCIEMYLNSGRKLVDELNSENGHTLVTTVFENQVFNIPSVALILHKSKPLALIIFENQVFNIPYVALILYKSKPLA